MNGSHVQAITVEGYRSIRSSRVELRALNVLVGANGSGKSSFIAALEVLGHIVDEGLQVHVGVAGGASGLLHRPNVANRIRLAVEAPKNGYEAVLAATQNNQLIFDREVVYRTEAGDERSAQIGRGHFETALHRRVVEKGKPVSVESYVIKLLRGCRVYHFHDTSSHAPVKAPGPTADNLRLGSDARNLAAMLWLMREAHPAEYRRIVETVRLVAPFFQDFVLEPEASTDTIRLRWRQAGLDDVFSAHQMSDGTLRFVCLSTLLLQPNLPPLIVLDEPELGLHPFAVVQLAEMLKVASDLSQVVVATQSVTLIDELDLGDLIVVERRDGASDFGRPDPDRLRQWLNEYSLGELWKTNLIGGRPQYEAV